MGLCFSAPRLRPPFDKRCKVALAPVESGMACPSWEPEQETDLGSSSLLPFRRGDGVGRGGKERRGGERRWRRFLCERFSA